MANNKFTGSAFKREEIKGESYDKENTTILRDGKDINLWQLIQDSREDTELYETLTKYGSIKPMETNLELVYGDLGEINNLRDLYEQDKRSLNLWNSLPVEIRNEFGNNRYTFVKDGEQWLKNKIAEKSKPTVEEKPTEAKE